MISLMIAAETIVPEMMAASDGSIPVMVFTAIPRKDQRNARVGQQGEPEVLRHVRIRLRQFPAEKCSADLSERFGIKLFVDRHRKRLFRAKKLVDRLFGNLQFGGKRVHGKPKTFFFFRCSMVSRMILSFMMETKLYMFCFHHICFSNVSQPAAENNREK